MRRCDCSTRPGEVLDYLHPDGALVAQEQFGFDDLLGNLLAARAGASALLAPIHQTDSSCDWSTR